MTNKIYIPKDKKLLDPKVDSTFKTLFTKDGEDSKIALKGLVKAITGLEPEDIIVISIEMQACQSQDDLAARSLYYGSRMVSGTEMKSKFYYNLPKVYQVMFTDFNMFGEDSDYLLFVQMPLFKESGKNVENFTELEKWVIFLRDSKDEKKRDLLNAIMDSDEGIRKAG